MPYKTFWYKENKVIFTEVIGDFSEDDMINMNREYVEIYFATDHQPIHLIADLRAMSNFPKSLALIRDVTKKTALQPALGWILLIGLDNTLVKFLSTTVFQLLRVNCKIVETTEEAEEILKRVDFADLSN